MKTWGWGGGGGGGKKKKNVSRGDRFIEVTFKGWIG